MDGWDLSRGAPSSDAGRLADPSLEVRWEAAARLARDGATDARVLIVLLEGLARGEQPMREATGELLRSLPVRQLARLKAGALLRYGAGAELT